MYVRVADITTLEVDAVVNAANESLLGGGGVDGAIHRAAGPRLLARTRTMGGCKVGEAKVAPGYDMPCEMIVLTVGPRWAGGDYLEDVLLADAYRNSLIAARDAGALSVAFPAISTGVYGFPARRAAMIAALTVTGFLAANPEMRVTLVAYSERDAQVLQAAVDMACQGG